MANRITGNIKEFLRTKHFVYISIIIVLGIIVYSNSFRNEFVYDDGALVNDYVKDWHNFFKLFTKDVFCSEETISNSNFSQEIAFYYYRPLQSISYMIDYYLWKLNPTGYHITNLLWHLLTVVLIYFLVNLILRNSVNLKNYTEKIALIAGLLFVIHPIHTEAVTYISGRTDLMASSFILLAFIMFIKYTQSSLKRRKYYIYSIISFILALLSKETAVMFPFILLLYDYSVGTTETIKLREKIIYHYSPFVIIVLIYAWLRLYVLNFGPWPASGINFYIKLLTAFKSFILYIKLLLLPFDLHMDRSISMATSLVNFTVLGSIALLILMVIAVKKAGRNYKIVLFSALWFLIFFLPTSNLLAYLPRSMLEHWIYFPSIGFFIILATGIVKLLEMPVIVNSKNIVIPVFTAVISIYAMLTIRQNTVWENPITLYQNMLKYHPDNIAARGNLGNAYASIGMLDEAIREYNIALKVNPGLAELHGNLANVYINKGLLDDAIKELEEAKKLNPNYITAYNNSGSIYFSKGLFDDAEKEYKKGLILNPDNPQVHANLGNVYVNKGELDQALKEYNEALRIVPNSPEMHNNLGAVYLKKGVLDDATRELEKALKLKPAYLEAHNNLGDVYAEKGMFDEALKEYQEAMKLNPLLSKTQDNMANIYKRKGLLDDAIRECNKALRLDSNYVGTHSTLASIYEKKGMFDEAMAEYKKVLTIDSSCAEAHNNLGNLYATRAHNDSSGAKKQLFNDAIKEYKEALKLKKDYLEAHNNLGNVYRANGMDKLAREEYNKALEIDPNCEAARLNLQKLK